MGCNIYFKKLHWLQTDGPRFSQYLISFLIYLKIFNVYEYHTFYIQIKKINIMINRIFKTQHVMPVLEDLYLDIISRPLFTNNAE